VKKLISLLPSLLSRVCILVAVALTAVSCGSSPGPVASGEPAIGPWLSITDLKTAGLPLDPYRLGLQNLGDVPKADDILLARCIHRFGYDIPPPVEHQAPAGGLGDRYGVTDEQQAQSRGYHGPANLAAPAAGVVFSPVVDAIATGRGQSSYNGQAVPNGGCLGEAQRKLQEGAPAASDASLGESLSLESYDLSQRDSRVLKVFMDWSSCMNRSGYSYANPRNANNDPMFAANDPSPQEIAVAVADLRCKKETNLVNVWATVETAYQSRLIEQNAAALSVLKKNFEVQKKNAAAVLAGK
jgi:hypothetical protein